jgi:acyl phosphate:glycerol-3-phosphate acyltransferase
MNINLIIILTIISGYLIGSIPTGLLVGKYVFKFDIREKGSGSTGSTNSMRIFGMKWGIFVLIVDVLKGFIPAAIIASSLAKGSTLFGLQADTSMVIFKLIAGLSAILGHIFPIFAGFRGGKGVNTALGLFLAVAPYDVLLAVVVFVLTWVISGYVSLGSMSAGVAIPIILLIREYLFHIDIGGFEIILVLSIIVACTLFYTHRNNIKRLRAGTEHQFVKAMIFKKKEKGNTES